jgi:phosphopantothenoylcysteine decarboxylase / phosphopantothenate---cysteine ligase
MKALVTAGPTQEPIDPVRFVGNHSSGKMGIAIADELAARGYEVTLVKGPVLINPVHASVKQVAVNTAAEMFEACKQYFNESDVVVFAAAVADYTPKFPSARKIKKKEAEFIIEMVKTKDIAGELGKLKHDGQVLVGFALETDSEMQNAQDKLAKKNLDFIVLNSVNDKGAGFQFDTNKITIIDKRGKVVNFELKPKADVAKDIADYLAQFSKMPEKE